MVSCICLHPSCPASKRNAHPRDKRILAQQYHPAGVDDALKESVRDQPNVQIAREVTKPERLRRLSGPFSKSAPPAIGPFDAGVAGRSVGGHRVSWRLAFKSGTVRPMEGRAPLERQKRVEEHERPSTCPELGTGRRCRSASADITKREDKEWGNRTNIVIQVQQADGDPDNERLATTKL